MFRNMLAVFGGVGFTGGMVVVLATKVVVIAAFVGFMIYCMV